MSEEKKDVVDNVLSEKFYKMGAFALIMTSIAIFFGTIYMGYYVLSVGAVSTKFGAATRAASAAMSNDLILKGILTAIFAMLFAIVFMLNDLLRVLNTKIK